MGIRSVVSEPGIRAGRRRVIAGFERGVEALSELALGVLERACPRLGDVRSRENIALHRTGGSSDVPFPLAGGRAGVHGDVPFGADDRHLAKGAPTNPFPRDEAELAQPTLIGQ